MPIFDLIFVLLIPIVVTALVYSHYRPPPPIVPHRQYDLLDPMCAPSRRPLTAGPDIAERVTAWQPPPIIMHSRQYEDAVVYDLPGASDAPTRYATLPDSCAEVQSAVQPDVEQEDRFAWLELR